MTDKNIKGVSPGNFLNCFVFFELDHWQCSLRRENIEMRYFTKQSEAWFNIKKVPIFVYDGTHHKLFSVHINILVTIILRMRHF